MPNPKLVPLEDHPEFYVHDPAPHLQQPQDLRLSGRTGLGTNTEAALRLLLEMISEAGQWVGVSSQQIRKRCRGDKTIASGLNNAISEQILWRDFDPDKNCNAYFFTPHIAGHVVRKSS